ncbi:HNH endonuclease [Burkholderia phage Bcep22]|uniref:HNH endonuclease n=1 Tax=Burkholderia phage Bcep22 TaxID=2883944 RepID=Q6V7S9_9CAUD|nr:HNH endonuclease [Burkholderia phage Bcep22]AAQ54949.2 HNH endonuclease [Burkholderia phage Bcep22]
MATANPSTDMLFYGLYRIGEIDVCLTTGRVSNPKTGKVYDRIGAEGYIEVPKKIDSVKFGILAHRLVWMASNGRLVPEGFEINHENGIKPDNTPNNLELTTGSGNIKHAWDTGLIDRESRSMYDNEVVVDARRAFERGESVRAIARRIGAHRTTVRSWVRGEKRPII